MFVVFLKFGGNKNLASQFMQAHNAWIQRGVDDGVFLLIGSIMPNAGGMVLAHNTSLTDLESRLSNDPFVAQGVVTAEVLEIKPNRADKRLAFLVPA